MLSLSSVSVGYHDQWLFAPLDLTVDNGQIMIIDAPSGAGKSSLLRWIAGLTTEQMIGRGEIYLLDRIINDLAPEHRHIGYLFQSPLLFPHMTVAENLGFGMPNHYQRSDRKLRISESLERSGMAGMENRDPDTLSGGQQARVALLRTLLAEPKALLMDEPFSSLDKDMRGHMLDIVKEEVERLNLPVLMVSHDPRDHSLSNTRPVMLKYDQAC